MAEKIFHNLPFRAEGLGKKGSISRCDLAVSIRQNLRLLLISPPLRLRFDPYYGCRIHRAQFLAGNRAMEGRREEDDFKFKLEQNIETLIRRFEPRLMLQEVNIKIRYSKDDQMEWKHGVFKTKKRNIIQVSVHIKGDVKPEYAQGQTIFLEDNIPLL
jgi:phage baseplate assembly protein W